MKKTLKFSIIFSVIILFTASVFAEPRIRMRDRDAFDMSHTRILRILQGNQKELKITDNQLEKIKNMVFSFEEKMIKMKNESNLQRLELRKLMQDRKNIDYEKIKGALSKASSYRNNMFIERLKWRNEILNVLTPEQQEALKAMRKDMWKDRMHQRRPMHIEGTFQKFPQLKERFKEHIKK